MRQDALVQLRCPHCGKLSRRLLSFVAARRLYVCNHCHEMVPIDVGVAAVLHGTTKREPLAGHG